jgi:acetyltransferase
VDAEIAPARVLRMDCRPIDAETSGGTGTSSASRHGVDETPKHPFATFLNPSSIAVIGASNVRGKLGQIVFENLRELGYAGELYPVNQRGGEVQGRPAHTLVSEIGRPIDLAVIAVPAAAVPDVLRDCGVAGVKAAVVLSAGFREHGKEGEQLEREVVRIARENHIRLLGPNCLGLVRPTAGLHAIFGRTRARPGRLALVSQSGAVCTALLDWAEERGIGFSAVVSTGAAADIGVGDVLDFLALDPQTEAILAYLEGVDHPRRFMSGLRAAARMKPVVVLKAGRRPEGSRAAVSHTGALVGDDAVFDSALRRAGALRARDLEELFSAAELLARRRRRAGDRLAIVTNAGGLGVVAADHAADLGLRIGPLSDATLRALDSALPAHWSHGNPVDVLGDASPRRYAAALSAVLADPAVDGVIALLSPQTMTDPTTVAAEVIRATAASDKLVLTCFLGGAQMRAAQALLAERGVPHFASPEDAVEAFAQLVKFERNQQLLLQVPEPLSDPTPPGIAAARAIVQAALAEGRTSLSLDEGKALLQAFRLPTPPSLPARTADEAVDAAQAFGGPVALKIDSQDISHKSDVDGVQLGLSNPADVRHAFGLMMDAAARLRPDARIRGVTVEPMHDRRAARELLVGVTHDEAFGPALAFGAGGTLVELIADQAVALPPLNRLLARDLLERTRVRKLLGAFRGMPPVDLDAVERVLLRISELVCEVPEVQELDINPLLADPEGALAVDVRVVLAPQPPSPERYAHMAIQPYPSRLARTVELRDGSSVLLRPIRPEDARIEQRFVRRLSFESRYFRFHHGLSELTPEMLVRFTQIDYDREMAFIAVHSGEQGEDEVGVARYLIDAEGRTCEFALVVADEFQGRGIGSALMKALIETARDRGLSAMTGEVLTENRNMLELVRELGFSVERHSEDAKLRVARLEL